MPSQVLRGKSGTKQLLRGVGVPPLSRIAWQRSGYSPVTPEYRYIGAIPTAWASLTATTKFNDVSPTDPDGKTTYESGVYSGFYNRIFGAMYFGGPTTITSFTAQVYLSMAGTAALPQRSYSLYTSSDGVTWTAYGSAVTIPNGWTTVNWTGSVTCTYLALYVFGTNANQIPVDGRIGTFTIPVSYALQTPAISVDFCSIRGDSITFTVSPTESAEGIRVYRDGVALTTVFNPSLGTFTLTGRDSTASTWNVKFEHGSLESAISNSYYGVPGILSTQTISISSTPDCTLPGINSLLVSWTPITGSLVLPIYALKKNGVEIYRGTTTSFLVTGLTDGAYYIFTVTAVNTCSNVSSSLTSRASGWAMDCGSSDATAWRLDDGSSDTAVWRQVCSTCED